MTARIRPALLLMILLTMFVSFSAPAFALEPGKDGYYQTGWAVRQKKVLLANFDVYTIWHYIKELPAQKSKQALIDADVDKRFTWKMMREVPSEKIQAAMREAFAMNGYGDQVKINAFVGAFSQKDVADKSSVVIAYNAATKTTTITVQSGSSASIPGVDFMKAVWSIWFGKIDPPSIGDQLMRNL